MYQPLCSYSDISATGPDMVRNMYLYIYIVYALIYTSIYSLSLFSCTQCENKGLGAVKLKELSVQSHLHVQCRSAPPYSSKLSMHPFIRMGGESKGDTGRSIQPILKDLAHAV